MVPLTETDIESKILELLVNDLQADAASIANANAETPLLGRGIGLDSVEALRLALGLENAFGISIPDRDLNAELFASLGALTRYVYDKCRARQNTQ